MARLRSEEAGREILDKYCQNNPLGPIMIPPIPDSKFFEKLPHNDAKRLQDGYQAEVEVYRCFEELERDVIVIHQLEYTHKQYSAFVPQHNCTKKKCEKGPGIHPCHKSDNNKEGENDFVVIGPDFVAVFEVKGLIVSKYQSCCYELISKCSVRRNGVQLSVQEKNAVKFEGCCEGAARQRHRMVTLFEHLNNSMNVFQFTIFPNISKEEVDEEYYLSDSTLLFSEVLENFTSWFNERIPLAVNNLVNVNSNTVKCCLLGLWCLSTDNSYDTSDCSLFRCIKDVDTKLKRALVTQWAVDQALAKPSLKNQKPEQKKYPENLEMVKAPDLFKKYLNISCLTQDQLDVFNCEERFLWVDGPAGSGKTIAMIGKIIDIVLKTQERVLVITAVGTAAVQRCHEVLNRDDITCTVVTHYNFVGLGGASYSSSSEELRSCSSRIVILVVRGPITSIMYDIIERFNNVFVDDFQILYNTLAPSKYDRDNLAILLSSNNSVWVFCDLGQSMTKSDLSSVGIFDTVVTRTLEFRNRFKSKKSFSVNLRNTYEISEVLSVIRRVRENFIVNGKVITLELRQQKNGHFLRGTKPTIYLLRDGEPETWKRILEEELDKLTGGVPDFSLDNNDIAVLYDVDNIGESRAIEDIVKIKKIKSWNTLFSMSAEWPAVVCMFKFSSHNVPKIYRESIKEETHSVKAIKDQKAESTIIIPHLYTALSRARVYSTVIICNYTPNKCEHSDKVFSELRKRWDICRIIDVPALGQT